MEEIIKVDNLTFEYGNPEDGQLTTAVKNISVSIEKGSFTAIIGRNGSGKSTIAKNFNALLLPTEGAVYVKGMDTRNEADVWNIRQTCGMVFQNPDNQLVSSVVEDDIAFGPENLGVAPEKIREAVSETLFAVDMYEFRKKAPHMLSGGQKQRVAIAGVAAMRPECIIFDEPTAMLDPKGRKEVMSIIEKLHNEGITVVLITHFMEEAAAADRAIIMHGGEILCDGSPAEVFAQKALIEKAGLSLPFAADIRTRLKENGIDIREDVINEQELLEELCLLK